VKVYISGLCAEPVGVAGIGLARAIRSAYPHARLIVVSYASQRTIAQWPDCDETWVVGPPQQVDLETHRRDLRERLEANAWWISGLSWEPEWLRHVLPGHKRLLAAPASALEQVRLPAIAAAAELGLSVPGAISAAATDWELNSFGRRHGWQVWLRMVPSAGHMVRSHIIQSWQAFHQSRMRLGASAFSGDYFLQEHIEGTHEAIAFCALDGELLGSALLERPVAAAGELVAERVTQVPAPLVASLAAALRRLQWTGGGEMRLIRDRLGRRWVIDWRASFPAWSFGATLAGHNLPARLLERVTGVPATLPAEVSERFARVVIEVPVRQDAMPSADLSMPTEEAPQRSRPLAVPALPGAAVPQISPMLMADVARAAREVARTPGWLFLPTMAGETFAGAAQLMGRFSTPDLQVRIAYSVKTNPDQRLIELARVSGLLAETISQAEVRKAAACGFAMGRIILNGPAKRWPAMERLRKPLHAVFCDSLEELEAFASAGMAAVPEAFPCETLGVRLRPLGYASRFGIPLCTTADTAAIGALVARLPEEPHFGIHFHLANNAIGLEPWWQLFDQMLDQAQAIERAGGRHIACLDIGGGWFPDDWAEELPERFGARIMRRLASALPHVRELILEPGRALAQPSMALAVRVLEVRRRGDGQFNDVVVDGSIAELAYHNYTIFPHRVLWHNPDDTGEQLWRPLGRGTGRILGRLCMEKDILAEALAVPESLRAGDLLVICDAGAYDRSMSYSFGQG
jgi:diaminopimelate decarboxylase